VPLHVSTLLPSRLALSNQPPIFLSSTTRESAERQNVITPTIGRRVWLFVKPGAKPPFAHYEDGDGKSQPHDAGIAYVWGDRCINISVAGHDGTVHNLTSVPLRQEGDPESAFGWWCEWMPYQVGQAKKHEPATS